MEITLDTNVRAARQLAAGRVTATFVSPTGTHITLTAKCRAPKESGTGWETSSIDRAKVIFIEVPNDSGYGDKVAKVTQSKGLVAQPGADKARVWCAEQLLNIVAGRPTAPSLQILIEDTCGKCGRALTDPISIERGLGPDCANMPTGSVHQTKGNVLSVQRPNVEPRGDAVSSMLHGSAESASGAAESAVGAVLLGDDAAGTRQGEETAAAGGVLPVPESGDGSPSQGWEHAQQRSGESDATLSSLPHGAGRQNASVTRQDDVPSFESQGTGRKVSRPQRTLGWREEKNYVAQARADVKPTKPSRADRPCSQMSELPGTTWEDIFR